MKYYFILLLLTLSIGLVSITEHDKEISNIILETAVKIDYETIDEALEFDPTNQKAYSLRIDLMYADNISLNRILKEFDYISQYNENLLKIKLEILYRLEMYKEISFYSNDYISLKDNRSKYYIIDSFIRSNRLDEGKSMLMNELYDSPYNLLFNELNFILTRDSGSLRIIRESKDRFNSLFRIYGRNSFNSKSKDSLIMKVINWELEHSDIDLSVLVLNFELLHFLKVKDNISGVFKFDNNFNLFIDTEIKVDSSILDYKKVDRDGDRVFDNITRYKNGMPYEISDGRYKVVYNSYPYISYSKIGNTTLNKYFEEMLLYRAPGVLSYELPILDFIETSTDVDKRTIKYDYHYEIWNYLENDMAIVSRDFSGDKPTHKILIENGIIISGVRDLNSDGDFDIYENYTGGKLVGALYLKDESYKYYENYLPLNLKIISNEKGVNNIIIEKSDNKLYSIEIDNDSLYLEDILDFNKDDYNWWQ